MANPPSPPPPPPPQPSDPIGIDGADEDAALSSSAYLTHQELLTRRSRRLKQLAQIFRAHYWTLMEELKIKHKEYYWIHGKSPYEEDEKNKKRKRDLNSDKENFEWNTKLGINGGGEVEAEEREEEGVRKCSASGCKARAMALTTFCYTHILSDSKQKLYKGCAYVVKRYDYLFIYSLFWLFVCLNFLRFCCVWASLSCLLGFVLRLKDVGQ